MVFNGLMHFQDCYITSDVALEELWSIEGCDLQQLVCRQRRNITPIKNKS